MKIVDRRSSSRAWFDVDEDDNDWIDRNVVRLEGMTVTSNENGFDDSGLLDASGRPLGRRRRGPGFGIYR